MTNKGKKSFAQWRESLVIIRGGGDIATGTIYKLFQCGFSILVLEIANPSCIRRTVSFCEASLDGETTVEGVTAKKSESLEEAYEVYKAGMVPLMIDEKAELIKRVRPAAVVDAILAKRNLGTSIHDAPFVVGVGPGFCAGKDVHAVIETKRGHDLGRVIYQGEAAKNTGVPGVIAGYGKERVIHAPGTGQLHILHGIGEIVAKGEPIAVIRTTEGENIFVHASLDGLIRGMIRESYFVKKGLKIADIDPRVSELENCYKISDKARCIAGGVLEAILHNYNEKTEKTYS